MVDTYQDASGRGMYISICSVCYLASRYCKYVEYTGVLIYIPALPVDVVRSML